MLNSTKIAIVVSHPIQHFVPWYSEISKKTGIELKVFFANPLGFAEYYDAAFKKTIKWEVRLDFPHVFLSDKPENPSYKLDNSELNIQLDRYCPDLVFIYGYSQKYQLRAYKWAIDNKKKLFFVSDVEDRQKRGGLKKILKSLALRFYFKKIDYFLTVGDANESYYTKHGVSYKKMIRTKFPIDQIAYSDGLQQYEKLRSNLRTELGIAQDDVVLINVGKLVRHKRQVDILKALELMQRSDSDTRNCRLLVIGSGEDKDFLENHVAKLKPGSVRFVDFVKPKDLVAYYAASDIYILSSEHDPHSLAVTEATYMRCAVIASDKCGLSGPTDDVQPGKNGFEFSCGDIAELAQKIALLRDNPEVLEWFKATSHEIAINGQREVYHNAIFATTILSKL
ncbi:MAG: glycosyltransferase family 4 protein [Saprospiraceae bacterium]|nr:glycosyltransferase family 4 protein [Saprospiraceae bacterium]